MKTKQQIQNLTDIFKEKHNIDLGQCVQGSEMWHIARLGVMTASNASKIVAKKDSETRLTYMSDLVAQIATKTYEEINSKYLDWGNNNEAAARSSYSFYSGLDIEELPFVFLDEKFRVGCSPDGIIENRGVEIKCPYNAANYIKFLCEDKIKPDYQWQVQFSMYVLGCDEYDFCQFHPNMKKKPIKIISVKKDEEKQKTLADAIPQFIDDMDLMLKKVGIEYGDQWK